VISYPIVALQERSIFGELRILSSSQSFRPIAADLVAALTALARPQRDRVLGAILETDEPLVLA
jgi:hypothetical protein